MIYHSIVDLIGNTPLLELSTISIPNNNKIFAKLEFFNPAGGIKDRMAFYILNKLKNEGKLSENSVIIEATAGNTGLGIALVSSYFKCKSILVVPDKFAIEKQILMKALGAEVINTPKEDGMLGAVEKAKILMKNIPNAISIDQFNNNDNPNTHYLTTAREIYNDMLKFNKDLNKPCIDYFVSGAGSGGSFSGIIRYLKEQDSKIQGVLCDPIGSIIGGGEVGCANIEGIGNNFIPNTMDTSLIDRVEKIFDDEAFSGLRLLASNGILAGISSGACLKACLKLANKVTNSNIVTIFADGFSRYFSKNLI